MTVDHPQAGDRYGGWTLLRPAEASEWESCWMVGDGAGRRGVLYLLDDPPQAEASALAAVQHPGLARVVGWGSAPRPFLVRARCTGRPLTAYLLSGPAPRPLAVSIAAQVASALAALHARDLVHGLLSDARVIVESVREPRLRVVGQGLLGSRWRGGLDHAAPECMRGVLPTAAADVYSLGLLLWQLLHGRLPWAELGRSQALLRRARQLPPLDLEPPGLAALLSACLSLDPAERPSARSVAEVLVESGAVLTAPSSGDLFRQLKAQAVADPVAARLSERWLTEGGCFAVVGAPGSGRSRFLDGLADALAARQRPYLRIGPGLHAWDPVILALTSPGLPGPAVPLPDMAGDDARLQAAITALTARCPAGFHVLVDDFDWLDGPSARLVATLAREEHVHVCVAARSAPHWCNRTVALGPWTRGQVRRLLRAVFGFQEGIEALAAQLWTVAGGHPGLTLKRLVGLQQGGALTWQVVGWRIDPARVDAALADAPGPSPAPIPLGADARQIGGFLACTGGPLTPEYLFFLASLPEDRGWEALDALAAAELIRVEHRQILVRDADARALLLRSCADPVAVHRRFLMQALELPDPDPVQVGWHLLGARSAEHVVRHGPRAIEAAVRRDPVDGVALAEGLWELVPHRALAAPRIQALARAGRVAEALAFGEAVLLDARDAPGSFNLHAALAAVLAEDPARAEDALRHAQRARGMSGAEGSMLDEIEARLCLDRGDLERAIDAARRVADLPPPEPARELDRWLAMRVLWARAEEQRGRVDSAIGVLDVLPPRLGEERPARAALDACLGELLGRAGRLAESVEAMERGVRREGGTPPAARARLLYEIGRARRDLGRREEALEAWREALDLQERAGEAEAAQATLLEIAAGLIDLNRSDEAEAAARLALTRASDLGNREGHAKAALVLTDLALERATWPEAERWLRRAAEGSEGAPSLRAEVARRRAELALRRRDTNASVLAEEAARLAEEAGWAGSRARAMLVCCEVRDGKHGRIEEVLRETIAPLRRAGASLELAEARLWIAEALLAAGRLVEAEQEATRALFFAQEMGHIRIQVRAHALVARARRTLADDPEARQLAQLLELSVALVREREAPALLERIATAALDLLEAGRAFVLVEHDGGLTVGAALARGGGDPGRPSGSVLRRVLGSGREIIADNLEERADLRGATSVVDLDLGSVLCVPMEEDGRPLGAIYVDSPRANVLDPSSAARLLRALAAHAAVAVANARHLAALSSKATEAAEIAHDLRSPASSITILAQELQGQLPDGHPGRDRLQRILEASQRIRDLAGCFIEEDLSVASPLDLSDLVARTVALEEPGARRARIQIELELEPGLVVAGRALALGRVLSNLLVNAVRHSPRDAEIIVSLAEEDGAAVCRVRDRGVGLPAGQEERVFERGVQGPGREGQRGLGLAIARRIVEQHGGRISARTLDEGGAEVRFSVPLRRG
ncbi:MAG: ATP-binding protein [Pseudomonadota bacterium]